jgi:hypothetical protein
MFEVLIFPNVLDALQILTVKAELTAFAIGAMLTEFTPLTAFALPALLTVLARIASAAVLAFHTVFTPPADFTFTASLTHSATVVFLLHLLKNKLAA